MFTGIFSSFIYFYFFLLVSGVSRMLKIKISIGQSQITFITIGKYNTCIKILTDDIQLYVEQKFLRYMSQFSGQSRKIKI